MMAPRRLCTTGYRPALATQYAPAGAARVASVASVQKRHEIAMSCSGSQVSCNGGGGVLGWVGTPATVTVRRRCQSVRRRSGHARVSRASPSRDAEKGRKMTHSRMTFVARHCVPRRFAPRRGAYNTVGAPRGPRKAHDSRPMLPCETRGRCSAGSPCEHPHPRCLQGTAVCVRRPLPLQGYCFTTLAAGTPSSASRLSSNNNRCCRCRRLPCHRNIAAVAAAAAACGGGAAVVVAAVPLSRLDAAAGGARPRSARPAEKR